jgi:hypothetical protein
MEFSRCARDDAHPTKPPYAVSRHRGLSKLNSVLHFEVDVILGEPEHRTAVFAKANTAIDESSAHRSKSSGIP